MNAFLLLATLNLIVGGLVFLLGFIILRENPRQRLNLVTAVMMFAGGLGSVLGALGFLAARQSPLVEDSVVATTMFQSVGTLWELFFPALLVFALLFPREHRLLERHGSLVFLLFVPHVFHFLLGLLVALFNPETGIVVDPPDSLAPVLSVFNLVSTVFLSVHNALFSLVNLAYGMSAAALLLVSFRRERNPRVRAQIRVIGFGLVVCLALYTSATSVPTLLNLGMADWVRNVLTTLALLSGSGAIAFAMVRYKFLDTKLLARKAILYAVASSVLVGLYLIVVLQVNRFFGRLTGVDARVFEPVFLILALILFQPAVSRLEDALESLLMRDPTDYRNVLRRLGRELLTNIDLDLLLARSIRVISEALLVKTGYIVALSREAPLIHVGAGLPVPQVEVDRLPSILARIPADKEVYRLGELREALTRDERRFLRQHFGAEIVIPLRTMGETVGGVLLGAKETETVYTVEDLNLLSQLAGQLSVSLQNGLLARDRVAVARFEEELNLARQIQRSFLPSHFPEMERVDLYAMTIPSKEVGGDLYDFVPAGQGSYLLAIADVSGKGVPAALLSSMLQASLRTQAGSREAVSNILGRINRLVFRSTTMEQFATFFLAELDESGLRFDCSNAGHNYPLLFRRGGETVTLERGGVVLGILDEAEFEEEAHVLRDGDRLVFFTDGVSEARNLADEEFGEERLAELVRGFPDEWTAEEVVEGILEEFYAFLGDEEAQDDVTLMVLQVKSRVPAEEIPDTEDRRAVGAEAGRKD